MSNGCPKWGGGLRSVPQLESLGPRGRIRRDQIRVVSGSQFFFAFPEAVGRVKSKEQESVGDEYYLHVIIYCYMLFYVMLIDFG